MTQEFWNGRKVFITGHTGFKGGWLSLWLQMLGARLYGYSLAPPSDPNLFTLADIKKGMESVEADIRDGSRLAAAMQGFLPEIVIHMAAQSLVRKSYLDPVETYETNVMGTVNLLDAIRKTASVKTVIIVTSDKCYRNHEWERGYREEDELGGHDPYSNSKACAELVTAAYRDSYFNNKNEQAAIASVRAGNVIGGGDWADDRLIPDLCSAFAIGKSAEIRNPGATRPWQHVLEPLSGYLHLAERMTHDPSFAGAWNFGPGIEGTKPVNWIADCLVELWGNGADWHTGNADQPHEAHTLRLDCNKARTLLGWAPRLRLDKALRLSVDWYKTCNSISAMREYTETQIQDYQKMRAG